MADTTSTTSFRADISQLKSAMQQAARQVKIANSEFKAATAGLDDWSKSATGLNAKLKQLDTTLGSQKKQLSLLEKELELTTKEYGENSAAADRVRVSINNQKAAISKTEKEISEYGKELKNAEKYGDNFTDTIEDMNDATKEASDGFTVMKGALANLVADGVRLAVNAFKDFAKETITVGANFEQSMSKVGAISGATSEDMDKLTAKAKEMGEKTVFSASESADAFQYMAMAGWKTEDMLNGIEGIMNLAAASGEDLATTSDIVTDALTAMGYSAGDAGKLADVMAAASANANTNVSLMGQTFQYAAPIIGALGYNMEDAAVAIGLMANAGIKGQKSGTALRSILTRLSAPPKECADAMDALGISLTKVNEDGTESMKSLDEVMGDLRKAFSNLSETQQTQYAKSIAGQEAMSGLLAIVNAAPKDYNALTEAVQKSNGAAQEMADTMNDNLQGQMTLLKSKIEGVQIQIYEHLAPAMKEAVGEIGNVVDSIDWSAVGAKLGDLALKLVKFTKKVIENFDGIVEVVKSVGTVLVATFVVNKIVSFVQTIQTVITAIKALKVATDTATASQKLLNLAQAATPIGIVTAAVAGLTTAVIYFAGKNKEAKKTVSNLTDAEKEQIKIIYEARDAYKDIKAARDEAVGSINAEYNNYKSLSTELDDLVDANGKVKEGYEDRVNFILTTLNEAVGTEMKLVDGVIQNYQEEKVAIDKLIETKRAEAILDANKEDYTNAIKNQKQALQDFISVQRTYNESKQKLNGLEAEYERLSGLTVSQYAEEIGQADNLIEAESQLLASKKKLKGEIDSTKIAIGESHMAMDAAERSYVNYNAAIKNYEGLSSAIISQDADKISEALSNINNDFITAETGTKQSLENQVTNLKQQYENMQQAVKEGSPVVTEEMVGEAKKMVDKAIEELDKFSDGAETSGSNGIQKYIDGMESKSDSVTTIAETIRLNAVNALDADVSSFEQAGQDAGQGYLNGLDYKRPDILNGAKSLGSSAVDALNEGQDSHSPSALTTTSGENFGQGFINGMDNKEGSIWDKAYSIARLAISALKKGQKEGSPSKITYQSGVYFVQGYVNGIASQQKKLQTTVSKMVAGVVNEMIKLSKYNFDTVAQKASDKFANSISSNMDYMLNKVAYQNEKKLAALNKDIEKLEDKRDKKLEKDKNKNSAAVSEIEKKRDTLLKQLDDKLEVIRESDSDDKKAQEKAVKKQIEGIKAEYEALINAKKKEGDKAQKQIKADYEKRIKALEKYRDAYQNASKEFLSEFQNAMSEYQAAAQNLINDTINGISDKYQQRYDALINKQNSLIDKMKAAGNLFDVSGAGIMTVNDLAEQTKQIKDYTSKLQKIKKQVSSELFDEITSFDMKEGAAYIDRLLNMSSEELKAYNAAYSEKLAAAEKAGEKIYKSDFKQLSKDYKSEINSAFKDLPKQLESLGTQALKGFMTGLTKDTDYMDKSVKTFISAMVNTFKKELKIKSPSRVMMEIGDFTGEGLIEGLKSTINNVKKTAGIMAQAVSTPLDGIKTSIGDMRSVVGRNQNGVTTQNNNTVNNYNLVQNNTSPKSLSALETYQARRQQIALIKAFAQ